MIFRDGTSDRDIYVAVVENNEYGLPDQMDDWVVIDIGAHIGSFAIACLNRGAKAVYSFEPNLENFNLLAENTKSFRSRSFLSNLAICGSHRKLALSGYNVLGTTINTGGASAHLEMTKPDCISLAIPLSIAISMVTLWEKDSVNLLKLDCEGSEWSALMESGEDLSRRIPNIVGEYHSFIPGRPAAAQMESILRYLGYREAMAWQHGYTEQGAERLELGIFRGVA